ncbi:hypothetical protein PGB90_010324 [Kerria lacca]
MLFRKQKRFDAMNREKENTELRSQDIISFFDDSTIFLTGVTGFLGQVLLSKLLTSCSGIRKIFILIREKKNKGINERFKEIFDALIFDKIKSEYPHYLDKVIPIKGDCLKPILGLSKTDRLILEKEVNVIFHVAATIRFNASLKEAVNINVRSTRDLLNIAKNMTMLQAFVYVSTVFSSCVGRTILEEKLYEPPIQANNLISWIDLLNDDATIIDRITSGLLDQYPNTYIFTKATAENLFDSVCSELPVSIFRPAIVISTAKEPIPGWINNGRSIPVVFLTALFKGLLKTVLIDKTKKADIVPADYVINGLISSAWYTAQRWKILKNDPAKFEVIKGREIPIFNFSSSETKNCITWRQFVNENLAMESELPSSSSLRILSTSSVMFLMAEKYVVYSIILFKMLSDVGLTLNVLYVSSSNDDWITFLGIYLSVRVIWACSAILNKYEFVHRIYVFLLHLIPAFVVDTVAILRGKKPKMWQLYQKMHKMNELFLYFLIRNWSSPSNNVKELWNNLGERDKQIFNFNLNNLKWNEYFGDYVMGLRLYVVKDDLDTLSYAKKKRKM